MINILSFIKKYYPFIFFILIIILTTMLFQAYSSLKNERRYREQQELIYNQNLSASIDSIKVEFNKKLQAYEYSKDNFVFQKLSELEKYNKSLYTELKKIKGDIISVIKTEAVGDLSGIKTTNNLQLLDPKNNYYGLKFNSNYIDPGFEQQIDGISKFYAIPDTINKQWILNPDTTIFETNITKVKITYGFKEYDDKYQVFAITPSNKITLTDLTGGYFINKQPKFTQKKPKKWGIGPYVGFGLNSDTKFNPTFGYSIGIGVHYDIFQW